MNMHYVKGQIVGYVPVETAFASVPAVPEKWYILSVAAGRDAKVMKAFNERGISAWSPQIVTFINRATGAVARRPHLGRRVVKPFLPGRVFVPDFEMAFKSALLSVPDVDGVLQLGTFRSWLNVSEMAIMRDIVSAESLAPSLRKRARVAIGQRVRVAEGAFAGFGALIEAIDSRGRLTVYVGTVERGVTVKGLTDTQIEVV